MVAKKLQQLYQNLGLHEMLKETTEMHEWYEYSKLTCKQARQIPENQLRSCLKNNDLSNFILRVLNGKDIDEITPSSLHPKVLSIDNTELPHPQNTDDICDKLVTVIPQLLALLLDRLRTLNELPTTMKVTLSHKEKQNKPIKQVKPENPRPKVLYDWHTHAKQRSVLYEFKRRKVTKALDNEVFLKLAKKLGREIVEQHFTQFLTEGKVLNIVRLNVSCGDFVPAGDVKKRFSSRTLKDSFSRAQAAQEKKRLVSSASETTSKSFVEKTQGVIDLVDEPSNSSSQGSTEVIALDLDQTQENFGREMKTNIIKKIENKGRKIDQHFVTLKS